MIGINPTRMFEVANTQNCVNREWMFKIVDNNAIPTSGEKANNNLRSQPNIAIEAGTIPPNKIIMTI